MLDTLEGPAWTDPARAHNAYRFLLLGIAFDGEKSIATPLGDFFGSAPGDRLTVHFPVPKAGRHSIELNLCMAPDDGRQRLSVNGTAAQEPVDCYSPRLYWLHPKLGAFDLKEGENTLEVEALEPNRAARPGNLFGLDYLFLVRQ